ncbi:MAG: PQQ-binding-like beta-propeller repeat protein [Planctomycetaceae bacterium]|nr:PQQ-binding-like beta-propeller repeat protein [Planctomycetales bacterium]MCB9922116.1 PQQ-binding-like beta-propeller repeat protein [Planctomycetaceae bacterium]
MYKALLFAVATCVVVGQVTADSPAAEPSLAPTKFASSDWPWWRGPARNGIAAADQTPPLKWSRTENVLWKAPIPGRGHGSVTVVGDQVYLATADEQADQQIVLCLDRNTGKEVWQTIVHDGGIERKGNKKASQASTTIACDGERLFVNFLNRGAVYTTALSRDGEQIWQTKITDYVVHQGYGSSPAIYASLVIVSADNKGDAGGAIAAMNRATGEIVWRHARPATPNYPSPIILNAAGRDQVFLTGCDLVSSYEPLTGEKLWEIEGATTECVTSTVTDGNIILTSGGYPKNHMSAVRADGSGEVVWENNVRVYVPSLLLYDGILFGVADAGVAMCWEAATGKELWKGRLGGTFSSSPVMVGKHIFVVNEAGEGFVFTANPNEFELVAKNQLGDEVFATPTICGSRIYMRVAEQVGDVREERLYCLGEM